MKTYSDAYKKGMEAVRQRPQHAPACPFDENREPDAHNGWTDGAIEAGIGEIYTNGVLVGNHRFNPSKRGEDNAEVLTNRSRAYRAKRALRSYNSGEPNKCDETTVTTVTDLIGDLLHLCDREGWDGEDAVRMALAHWRAER